MLDVFLNGIKIHPIIKGRNMNHITEAVLSQKVKVIPAEVYSRVSGYYRPVQQWNISKRTEFSERTYLNINKALNNYLKGDLNDSDSS